ncbi:hypothetical protein V4B17_03415 [Bartonella sp. B23]
MNTDIDSLCDLWMVLFQICNSYDGMEDEEHNVLVNTMGVVEKALVLKLEKEAPHIIKMLAVLTNFGVSEFSYLLKPLLKAYDPSLENPLKKVA